MAGDDRGTESTDTPPKSRLAIVGGAIATGVGVIALIGWHTRWLQLSSLGLGLAPMQYCTAIGMILAGLALICTQWRWGRSAVAVLGTLTAALGLANLVTYGFHIDLAIQQLLLGHLGPSARLMGPTTAIDLLVLGAGLLICNVARFRQRLPILILLGIIALGIGLYVLLGYAWDITTFYGWGHLTRMSPPAAISSLALGLGLTAIGWHAKIAEQPEQMTVAELRRSILVYTTGAVVLIVILSAVLAVLPIYHQLRLAQNGRLQEIAMVRSAAISQYILRAQTIAEQVSSPELRKWLKDYNAKRITAEQLAARSRPDLEDTLQASDELVGITETDLNGTLLVSVGRPIPQALWPKPVTLAHPQSMIGLVSIDNSYFLVIRNAVRDSKSRQLLGSEIVLVNASSPYRVLANRSDLGQTGHVALAMPQPHKVILLSAHPTSPTFHAAQATPQVAQLVRQASGKHQNLITPSLQPQVAELRFVRPVPYSPWVVLVSMNRTELYAAVDRQFLLTVLGVLLLALLGAMGMLLVLRPLTGGIVLRAGTLESKVQQATAALKHELNRRQRYEYALRESEERFDLAVRGSDTGIWDWDMRTNRVYFSPRWKSMIGYEENELPNEFDQWARRIHPDDYQHAMQTLQEYRDGVRPVYELEHRLQHKDGSYRWILARGIAVRDENGNPYRMAGSNQDITDRKRDEEKIKDTAAALERSNRELEQFAYIASHDLQEPLRKVIAFGDMLKRSLGSEMNDNSRDYLQRMQNGATRMQALIEGLLVYSRVASSAQQFEKVDLNTIVAEVLDDLQVSLQETGAKVTVGQLPTLVASPTQMRQLFQNLIGNAVKFHRPNVPPQVSVDSRPGTGPTDDQTNCHFAVTDNGIGFETDQVERIFKPFQRLHERERYPGTGIGLALCQKIVERHHGQITALSQPGKGSTFLVTLPLKQPSA